MNARPLALVVAGMCVLGALWFVREGLCEVVPAKAGDAGPVSAVEPERAPVPAVTPAPLEPAERAAVAPGEVSVSVDGDEDAEDPPTPVHPGPGQALLRVLVVARETEQPLAGVSLGLTSDDEEHEWRSSTQADPARGVENDEVLTDAAGHGEFVVQTDFAYTLYGEGQDGLAEQGELTLEPFRGGEEREVRLALPTAWAFDWHGRVVDENGVPIPGVEVSAYARGSAKRVADLHELARGCSDGDGRVVLRLPAWERRVALGRAPGRFLGGCWIDAAAGAFETAQSLTLRRFAALTALVTDSEGHPATDVGVWLTTGSWALGKEMYGLEDYEWSQPTDANGRCEFVDLPAAAELRVSLRQSGRMPQKPVEMTSSTLELAPGEHAHVHWSMLGGASVEARVRGRDGAALRGVRLAIQSLYWSPEMVERTRGLVLTWGEAIGHSPSTTGSSPVSDEEGRAHFEGVTAGWWALGPAQDESRFPGVAEVFRVPAELGRVEVELVLDAGGEIRGKVLTPDGQPARGSGVTWRGSEQRLQYIHGFSEWADRDGSFALSALVPGEYRLEASPDDPLHRGSEPVLAHTGDPSVEIHLRWAGIARGTVVDAQGQPVEAGVSVRTERGWDGGEFDLGNLAPGLHDFIATTNDGRIGVLRDVRIAGGEVLDGLVIPVSEGAQLTVATRNESDATLSIEIRWEGVELPFGNGLSQESTRRTVPPGEIVVRWLSWEPGGSRHFEHEERRTVATGQELTVNWELR
ncbi:MAG: hypothetical protein EXS08_02435 [Planctomycetes bacterium]|nr:hypothetical protein [Planctomycetota bacterium]